jgi:hypothetical protein
MMAERFEIWCTLVVRHRERIGQLYPKKLDPVTTFDGKYIGRCAIKEGPFLVYEAPLCCIRRGQRIEASTRVLSSPCSGRFGC